MDDGLDNAPGAALGAYFAVGFSAAANPLELFVHDALTLVEIGFFGREVGLFLEFGELGVGIEDDFEELDVGGLAALGGFVDGLVAASPGLAGGAFLLLMELPHRFAADGGEQLALQPAVEALSLAEGDVAARGVGAKPTPPALDAANDLRDAALGEAMLFGEFDLALAADLVVDVDLLVAGAGGGAAARLTDFGC